MQRRLSSVVLLTLAMLWGCAGQPTESSPSPPEETSKADDLLADDDCESFIDPASLPEKFVGLPPLRSVMAVPLEAPPEEFDKDLADLEGDPGLEIYVFSVDQCDAMLIVGPEKSMLVDLGEKFGSKANSQLLATKLEEILGKRHIDYFMVSHYHLDHVGISVKRTSQSGETYYIDSGIISLINDHGYKIGTFIDTQKDNLEFVRVRGGNARGKLPSSYTSLEEHMGRWLSEGKVASRIEPEIGRGQIKLGGRVKVEILVESGRVYRGDRGALYRVSKLNPNPYADTAASPNDLSIGFEVSCGNFEFFSAGDLTGAADEDDWYHRTGHSIYTNVEKHMVDFWKNGTATKPPREADVEVYRASHHGSGHSTTPRLLEMLDPEFVIYSAGRRNTHNHPTKRVVDRVKNTARQFVTHGLGRYSYSAQEFSARHGEVRGDIYIRVGKEGRAYKIEGEIHKAYSDAQEKAGDDEGSEWSPYDWE